MSDLQPHQPRPERHILVCKAVQDGRVPPDVFRNRPGQAIDLPAGMPHVVDLAFRRRGIPKPPIFRLKPLVPPIREHLPRFHAALQQ